MDRLLDEFMNVQRWEKAIDAGVEKGIDKTTLRTICRGDVRAALYDLIQRGKYKISPPRTQKIPKDTPGEYRTVYINENLDRIFLSILNDMLFELCHDMIHPACKSYQKGIGCGKVVMHISDVICQSVSEIIGFKADLSKYFDSVPIEYIDRVFDVIEDRFGKSAIIRVAREYYHQDLFIDEDGNLCQKYQSLKQGCALASFLADVILYELDDTMTRLDGYYCRYSDDLLYIGSEQTVAETMLKLHLHVMGLQLNPKKFQWLHRDEWFKFLGFNIKGDKRSLSKSRVKTFQKEIVERTVKAERTGITKAINQVNHYLYKGDYAWATSVLPIINVKEDIDELNKFVMDCIRACRKPRNKSYNASVMLGGLGVCMNLPNRTIVRGRGKQVTTNLNNTEKELPGYHTLANMRDLILMTRPLYDTIVRQM